MQRLHSNHEQCWELIPWVVNGRASEVEQRAVLAHVEDCSECRDELQRHREIHSHMRGSDDVIAAPNASWQKLQEQIDLQPTPAAMKAYRIKRPWLVAALWLQLIAIATLAGALFRSAAPPSPEYETLSSTQTLDRRAAVRVVFAPNASLDKINQLLRSVECDIVAGPSEAGVYTLAAAENKDVQGIIASLREHSEVLFAERSQALAGSSQ
ncbi:MAG: zf-HC2 domain-containing protein [Steroidobacter sp.]